MKSVPTPLRFSFLSLCLAIALAAACNNASNAPSSAAGAVAAESGAVIAGSVTGDSPAGLAVRVIGTNLATTIGSQGTFEIAGVPAGNAKLQFSKGDVNATADVSNITADQLITLQVKVNGSSAVVVSDARSDKNMGAEVKIEKFTNNERADRAPGPSIALGSPVQWRYVVTNSGRLSLTNLRVVDDKGETVTCVAAGTLASGASMTCSANGVVTVLGPYRNVGTVTADFSGPAGPGSVTASDASHYLGVSPVRIKKFTNGEDADEPAGPSIVVGSSITWRYVVTNVGLTPLSAITVVDDQGETVVCPSTGTLAAGATMTCSATGTAALGFYRNVGTVTATRTIGGITATVTDSDPSHYRGVLQGEDDGGPKVTLCHKTGNGSFHSITVSVNAEPAHRKHGDGKPSEAVPGQPGKIFGPSCSIQ